MYKRTTFSTETNLQPDQQRKAPDLLTVKYRVCGEAQQLEFDIAGIGVLSTRGGWWLERARGLPPPTVDMRAESKAEVSGSRAETRKAVKRSSTAVVAVFKFDRFPPTHANAQERGVLWARISRWSVGTSFRFTGSWARVLFVCLLFPGEAEF